MPGAAGGEEVGLKGLVVMNVLCFDCVNNCDIVVQSAARVSLGIWIKCPCDLSVSFLTNAYASIIISNKNFTHKVCHKNMVESPVTPLESQFLVKCALNLGCNILL